MVWWMFIQLLILNIGVNVNCKKKLYGSIDAADGQVPYAVFHIVRTHRGYSTCSGSIISPRWVLLATHCLKTASNPNRNLVVAGKANLNAYLARRYRMNFYSNINERLFDVQERRAAQIFMHPNYTRSGNSDIGLILLQRPFIINSKVSFIEVSKVPMDDETSCTLSGYGITESNSKKHVLQYIDNMPARPAQNCRYNRLKDVICLVDNSRGICHGDSGGPIVCQSTLRGVASFSLVREGASCGIGVVEQYYADAQRNHIWIDSIIS